MTWGLRQVARGAPDPNDAQRRMERLVDSLEQAAIDPTSLGDSALDLAVLCCQRAPYLATLLTRDPQRLVRVASDRYLHLAKPIEAFRDQLRAALATGDASAVDDFNRALRVFRADELVRLGARELSQEKPAEVGEELANLADVCLDAAIDFHRRILVDQYGEPLYTGDDDDERRAELVVIGMGKLGGQELNFSSDIDLIYVYSSDDGQAGSITLHEFFAKLCERVTASLSEVSDQDTVFRVDLRLRPEGSQGAIANSLASIERYYETFGRPWERQAWLKARPCAGSLELGAEILEMLLPFIHPRSTSPTVVSDVNQLNKRIKAELDSRGVESGFDVKNGVGGIREIEFFVQALQLIHAGHVPRLRSRSTVVALDQLLFAGLISEAERRELAEAYRYLRRVEHLLQLESGRQTQRLPTDPTAVKVLARRLGHSDAGQFLTTLERHTCAVAAHFATLGDDETDVPAAAMALARGEVDAERELELLAELGFPDPEAAAANLRAARTRPTSPLSPSATGAAARVAPLFLTELSRSPDPNLALAYARDLIGRRGSWSSIWGMMDANPNFTRLVASLFGTSELLSKSFVNHPEQLDALLQAGRAQPRCSVAELRRSLAERLADAESDEERQWDRLAEFKQSQVLRIGLADIGGDLPAEDVCTELSQVAEVCLECAHELVATAIRTRYGVARRPDGGEATLAVLALGKLGGRELGYASDLDLIFVYSDDGTADGPGALDNVTYMTRTAQRLMSALHTLHPGGRLYEVDTRLRPSGSQGLLVSSVAAWNRYHQSSARLWERQALTKLRPVAGDLALGKQVAAEAERFVYGTAPGVGGRETIAELAAGIADMRDRIFRELAGPGGPADVRLGPGSLIDIEFTTQFLQLAHGHEHPQLRTTSTLAALRAAAAARVANPEACALLAEAYRFLRLLEHRMRIVHDRPVHQIPADPDELAKLARRVGHRDGKALTASFQRWSERTVEVTRSLLDGLR